MKFILVALVTLVSSKGGLGGPGGIQFINAFGYLYTTADRVADGTYLATSQTSGDDVEDLYTFHTGECGTRYCQTVIDRDCRSASELIPGAEYVQATTDRSPFTPDEKPFDTNPTLEPSCDQDNGCSYDTMTKTVTQCDTYAGLCTERSPCLCLCVIGEEAGIRMYFSNLIGYVYDSFQEVSAGIAFLAAFGFMSTMYALVRACLFCKKQEYLPIEQPQN